jgi:hypothetical protein
MPLGFPNFEHCHHVFYIPNAIRHASGHCGSDAKRLMDAAKVVMHVVQSDGTEALPGPGAHLRFSREVGT